MSTKIPALPLQLPSSQDRDELPPLVPHYPRWSRNTPVSAASFIFTDRSIDSDDPYPVPLKNVPVVPKLSLKPGDSADQTKKTAQTKSTESAVPVSDPLLRISQLEQNIRFLKSQHSVMLTSLQDEIEFLRQRNRDLQFQLVCNQDAANTKSISSSENQESQVNNQKSSESEEKPVEWLEEALSQMQVSLNEVNAKNRQLTAIIENQKEQISHLNKQSVEITDLNTGKNSSKKEEDALRNELTNCVMQLEDAERIIQKLKLENDEQRMEIEALKANSSKLTNSAKKGNRNHSQQSQRFPPLAHCQSYWQSRNKQINGDCNPTRGNLARNITRGESYDNRHFVSSSLPHVRNFSGQNNFLPNGNYYYYQNYQRGNRNSDDYERNTSTQGYRKYHGGGRSMPQEPN